MTTAQDVLNAKGVAARTLLYQITSIAELEALAKQDTRRLTLERIPARRRALSKLTPFKVCTKCSTTTAPTEAEVQALFGWRTLHNKSGSRRAPQPWCRACRNAGVLASRKTS